VASSELTPEFSICCCKGTVQIPIITKPPAPLDKLLLENNKDAKSFKSAIRAYNMNLAFASLGAAIDETINNKGVYTFKIQGAIYHRMGALLPQPNCKPNFAQIYFHDNASELENRLAIMKSLDAIVTLQLQSMIRAHNPYFAVFQNMIELSKLSPMQHMRLVLKADSGFDNRRYNTPMASEVAVLMVGDGNTAEKRDVIVTLRDGTVNTINELNASYDPLHYVLIHPTGLSGFHLQIKYTKTSHTKHRDFVTMKEFYAYRLMTRPNCYLLRYGRLLQQYIVDMYAQIETSRLSYIFFNQKKLRCDLYSGIKDSFLPTDSLLKNIGKRYILPSSFVGSPRHMSEMFQDSMAMVREYGKPDLFVTFTCNPNWKEIKEAVLPYEVAQDRVDIVNRVFNLKLKSLMNDLTEKSVLGRVKGRCHVVEFQKRGLPHAHILLILHEVDKPRSPDDFDRLVCAEIPDETENPQLYDTIIKCNIHNPCNKVLNSPCWDHQKNKCSKNFPKKYVEQTIKDIDGYPLYRRRDNKRTVKVKGFDVGNEFVVPYNKFLSNKYDAHINVEICSSIQAVKYLYKYVYKGHDRIIARFEKDNTANKTTITSDSATEENNEIQNYKNSRYVSASEAFYRIMSYDMHGEYPKVERLAVHLEEQQVISFSDDDTVSSVMMKNTSTTLTEWMQLNIQIDKENRLSKKPPMAKTTYLDAPKTFIWNKSTKKWSCRKHKKASLGRMYLVQPKEGERYYLRMLLHHVVGQFLSRKVYSTKFCLQHLSSIAFF
jgi:hypothetical protein